MGLFILIKRGKRILGAIPARKGASTTRLKRVLRKAFKGSISFRIVSSSQLKGLIKRLGVRSIPRLRRRKGRKRKVIKRRKKRRK